MIIEILKKEYPDYGFNILESIPTSTSSGQISGQYSIPALSFPIFYVEAERRFGASNKESLDPTHKVQRALFDTECQKCILALRSVEDKILNAYNLPSLDSILDDVQTQYTDMIIK
jgi:hypothetical protein